MLRFLLLRVSLLALTLFAVSLVIFVITRLLPGDVATMILGMQATPEDLSTLRQRLGLDRPAVVQFGEWLAAILRGDLGTSTRFQRPVADILREPLQNSAVLTCAGVLFATPLGILLGLYCAYKRNTRMDRLISSVTMFLAAMPEFVTGGLLVIVFSTWLDWLPPFASVSATKTPFEAVVELILPVISLSLVILAYLHRMMRASATEVLESQHVKAAILKGLSTSRIWIFHVLPMAMGPTLSVLALCVGWMSGGLVVVESLFGYPGIGRLLVFAIQNRDVPLLEAIALIVASVYASANLLADIGQRIIDPRSRAA
jgi:peptide/nickel transport system permease protein